MNDQAFIDAVSGLDAAGIRTGREPAFFVLHRRAIKRLIDIALALPLCVLALPLIIVLGVLVRVTSRGPALYRSFRVGRDNKMFRMPKLRSMYTGAPELATHLFTGSRGYVTPIGNLLRRTSLDELPQFFSILAGDLSFVGPRPALFNQKDLVELRTRLGIHKLMPGLTGWAQVNGRDLLTIEEKVRFDAEYLKKRSFRFDLRILAMTVGEVLLREGISH